MADPVGGGYPSSTPSHTTAPIRGGLEPTWPPWSMHKPELIEAILADILAMLKASMTNV